MYLFVYLVNARKFVLDNNILYSLNIDTDLRINRYIVTLQLVVCINYTYEFILCTRFKKYSIALEAFLLIFLLYIYNILQILDTIFHRVYT